MNKLYYALALSLISIAVHATEILVSIESNGVLRAEGMEPGSACTIEWASQLNTGFTNNPAPFNGLTANSNGVVEVLLPMFFRVIGTPVAPEGMVVIPGGTNSGTDPSFGAYELTVESFYMDATEVTKTQWNTVYNWAVTNGYSFDSSAPGKGADHPVHWVHWYDCVKWCNARSEMDGKVPCYTVSGSIYKTGESAPDCNFSANGYRLPTSEEWEYAARGGLSGKRFPWGDIISHTITAWGANYEANKNVPSYDYSYPAGYHPDYDVGGFPYTSPVGDFPANGYGLYDMAGNVSEWCWDLTFSDRVLRGGSWTDGAPDARCGFEDSHYTGGRYNIGFRTVCR